MSHIPEDTGRDARYSLTRKKHITITQTGCLQIERWADAQGLNFSTAIESLALLGMHKEEAITLPALTSSMLERVVLRQFNRFAHLLSQTIIAAESSNWKTDYLILQLIRQEANADPQNFVHQMAVSSDPQNQLASQIRQMRHEVVEAAHHAAVIKHKKRIDGLKLADEEGVDE